MGHACISHYKKMKRQCVFSHEELVCKMAADAESLDLLVAVEAHKDLLVIVDQERKLRKMLMEDVCTLFLCLIVCTSSLYPLYVHCA